MERPRTATPNVADQKPNLHKRLIRLLLLTLLIGPLLWVVASRDGQRFADSMILSLRGDPEMQLALEHLRSDIREEELNSVLESLGLECLAAVGPFGNRVCQRKIASFNGIPARHVSFHYAGDTLTVMQIAYQPVYHVAMHDYVSGVFGPPTIEQAEETELWVWPSAYGRTVMPRERPKHLNDTKLIWMGVGTH